MPTKPLKTAARKPAPELETRKAEMPMEFRLAPVKSVDAEARTVDVTWTTGAKVRRKRWDWARGVVVEFDESLEVSSKAINMTRLKNSAPALDSHNLGSTRDQVGVIEKAWLAGPEGLATIRFAKAGIDENADRVAALVADGIIRNVSVGYSIDRVRIVPATDKEVEQRIVERWTPYEISFVTAGADPGAQVRGADDFDEQRTFPVEIIRATPTAKERTMDPENETGVEDTGADKDKRVQPAAQPAAPDIAAIEKRAAEAERQRLGVIDDLATRHGFDAKVVDGWKKNGAMTVDKIREAAFEEMAKRSDAQSGHSELSETARVMTDAGEKFMRGAENSIILRAGQAGLIAAAAKARGETAPKIDAGEFRGMSLIDLARSWLEHNGERSGRMTAEQIYKRALMSRSGGVGYGAQGTGDFAVLLETTFHKILLGAYATAPDTWSRFCKIGSVTDFRPHPRYRKGSFGGLDALNEHGEYRSKAIPDGAKYTAQATTKGNKIGITRQAIINDDMGVFSDLASDFGRSAKLTIELEVHALLSENSGMGPTMEDSNPFFHTSRANVAIDGIPSVALFDDIGVKMGSQMDISGNEVLDLKPSILLAPRSLSGECLVINDSQYDPDTANKLQRPNKVRGLFSDVVGTTRRPGTRLYAFADPNIAPAFEVVFLNGEQEPFVESKEGWDMDGMEWKVRLDFGVGPQDHRGAVTAKGAA